jgi:hypothetical protein
MRYFGGKGYPLKLDALGWGAFQFIYTRLIAALQAAGVFAFETQGCRPGLNYHGPLGRWNGDCQKSEMRPLG